MGRAPQEKEIARWLTMRKALLLAFLLLVGYAWSTPSVLLKTERHRTEWHFVNYRFLLVNTSSFPILNAEIRYYAVAAPLAAAVDYSSGINPVIPSASLNGRKVSIIYKRVKLEEYGGIRLLSIRFFD